MQRSKFPYTARSSAKVIRHAVSIDERRAKFRQDLISGGQPQREDMMNKNLHRYDSDLAAMNEKLHLNGNHPQASSEQAAGAAGPRITVTGSQENKHRIGDQLSIPSQRGAQGSSDSLTSPMQTPSTEHLRRKGDSQQKSKHKRRTWSQPTREQDIEEVWFAGGHGDIGGGWTKADGEKWMLSHAPLVWMVHEAERAGLKFHPGYEVPRHYRFIPRRITNDCPEKCIALIAVPMQLMNMGRDRRTPELANHSTRPWKSAIPSQSSMIVCPLAAAYPGVPLLFGQLWNTFHSEEWTCRTVIGKQSDGKRTSLRLRLA